MRAAAAVVVIAGCSFAPPPTEPAMTIDAAVGQHDAATHRDAPMPAADAPPAGDAAGTWACGAEPDAPPTTVTDAPSGASLVMSAIDLDGMGQQFAVAKAVTVGLTLTMSLTDTRCQECEDQLEVGWMQGSSGNRSGCAFDNGVPNPGGVHTTITNFQIATPSTAGVYDLRTNIGQNFSCDANGANNWWAGEVPAADTTIVRVCVH